MSSAEQSNPTPNNPHARPSSRDTWVLPFHPEPLDQLRKRYQRALRPLFDCRTGKPRPQPHELYSCLFDWPDGLRLTVSRKLVRHAVDDGHEDRVYLMFSAMPYPGSTLDGITKCRTGQAMQEALENLGSPPPPLYFAARTAFAELSDDQHEFEFMGFNQRGMPHWRRRLEYAG